MARLNWLHLSDLHLGTKGSRWLQPEYRDEFDRDLRAMVARTGPVDLVLITGDLTLSGIDREFEVVTSALESLWSSLRALGSDPCLLVVPGNHDLRYSHRTKGRKLREAALRTPLGSTGLAFIEEMSRDNASFTRWVGEWQARHPSSLVQSWRQGLLPGDFVATLIKDDLRVGVAGLNLNAVDFRITPEMFHDAVGMQLGSTGIDVGNWMRDNVLSILLTHDWAPRVYPDSLTSAIRRTGGVGGLLELCGGLGEDKQSELLFVGDDRMWRFQGPSLFSGIYRPEARFGYAVGSIISSAAGAQLKIFPRLLDTTRHVLTLGPPPEVAADADEAWTFDVDEKVVPRSEESPVFEPWATPLAATPQAVSALLSKGPSPEEPQLLSGTLVEHDLGMPDDELEEVPPPTVPAHGVPLGLKSAGLLGFERGVAVGWLAWNPSGVELAVGLSNGQLLLWNPASRESRSIFEAQDGPLVDVCFSPDGRMVASRTEHRACIFSAETGRVIHSFEDDAAGGYSLAWSSGGVLAMASYTGLVRFWSEAAPVERKKNAPIVLANLCMAWSSDGRWIAFGSERGGSFEIWETERGVVSYHSVGHSSAILDLAWKPDSTWIATASRDKTIRVWDIEHRGLIVSLEGHTDAVISVSFSFDGRLLASKSFDGTVRLFCTDTWECVAILPETVQLSSYAGLAFSPRDHTLASLAMGGLGVRLWRIDIDTLLKTPATGTVHSVSAKVVLVGEGRAGKSCLALRLADKPYEELSSTHGMRFWPLPVEAPDKGRDQAHQRRELVLWDMGGQSEYRLVHQLFLRDTTVALMVMEPSRGKPALDEVEGWNQRFTAQLRDNKSIRKLLVGTKMDDETAPVDLPAINHMVQRGGFESYFSTSAKTGRGVAELKDALAKVIDWGSFAQVSRPELFQRIRQHIQKLRDSRRVVLTLTELEAELRRTQADAADPEALRAVVGQLAKQGVLADTRLGDGTRALVLDIEQVERYAGSLVVVARDNPRGVPAVDMAMVLSPSMQFPRIRQEERLTRDQELVVLDCVIELLLEHGLCLRHEGLLIFPSLFQPTQGADTGAPLTQSVSLYYDFSGATDNMYASLVTGLAMSRRFGTMRLWEDRAEFGLAGKDASGIRKVHGAGQEAKGLARLDVFFDAQTPESTRELFVNFIEEHLREQGAELLERLSITCACGQVFPEEAIQKRLMAGNQDIGCPSCDQRIALTLGAQQARDKNPDLARQVRVLRTEIRDRLAQSVTETKVSMGEARRASGDAPIRILHLSDLHVRADADAANLAQPLIADLRDSRGELRLERLDFLVISGDITNRATPEEFQRARELVSLIIEEFGLTAERCVIVPGNHDLDWEAQSYAWLQKRKVDPSRLAKGSFREAGEGYNVRDDARYPDRFKNFSQHFYHPLMQKEYPLAFERQCIPLLSEELRLQFLALNSAWEIDEFFQARSSIHGGSLSHGLGAADADVEQARRRQRFAKENDILRLAVWHHPITGNEKIQSDAFMYRLKQANVRMCLHGHVHEERAELVGYVDPANSIHVVGAGSFGAPAPDRPESAPRLYNVLEVERDHSRIRVHTRSLRKDGGAWEGWAVWPGETSGERRTYYDVTLR